MFYFSTNLHLRHTKCFEKLSLNFMIFVLWLFKMLQLIINLSAYLRDLANN